MTLGDADGRRNRRAGFLGPADWPAANPALPSRGENLSSRTRGSFRRGAEIERLCRSIGVDATVASASTKSKRKAIRSVKWDRKGRNE